jgi:hypothetical protein
MVTLQLKKCRIAANMAPVFELSAADPYKSIIMLAFFRGFQPNSNSG